MTGQHVPSLLLRESVINPRSQVCVETCPGAPGVGIDRLKPHDIPPAQPTSPRAPKFSVSTPLPLRLITGACLKRDLPSTRGQLLMSSCVQRARSRK